MAYRLYHPVKRVKLNDGQNQASRYIWGLGMKKSHPLSGTAGVHERHQLGKRAADPYEFDDENHQTPSVNMDGFKRKEGVCFFTFHIEYIKIAKNT